jgi:hypothetical protein
LRRHDDPAEVREILISLLSTSGTLAGFSIGLMSVANLKVTDRISTFADEMFLFAGVGFLASLALVVVAGFLVLYEFLL